MSRVDNSGAPVLRGDKVTLRPPREEDADERFRLGNDPDIGVMFGASRQQTRPMTQEDAELWVRNLAAQQSAWVIQIGEALAGEVRLDNVDQNDRRAALAIGILDPSLIGRGFGTEAILLVLGHAFGEMGLHRVGVRVLAYNERAIRAYKRCGFVIEGRERETAWVDGGWHDDIMMGLLSHEFTDRMGLAASTDDDNDFLAGKLRDVASVVFLDKADQTISPDQRP